MNIGIIGAMDEEVSYLIQQMEIERKDMKAMMCFNKGKLFGKNVVIVRSGIGKVNAAICTQILVDDYNIDAVINVGVAGGIGTEIYPGDVVIGDSLIHHDVDTSAFGEKLGQIPRMDVFDFKSDKELVKLAKEACNELKDNNSFIGTIVSGDQFIGSVEKIRWLSEEFNGLACEMEGASIAHTAYLNHIPFVVIRSISDNANNGAHVDYNEFKDMAARNANAILIHMLKSM